MIGHMKDWTAVQEKQLRNTMKHWKCSEVGVMQQISAYAIQNITLQLIKVIRSFVDSDNIQKTFHCMMVKLIKRIGKEQVS